MHVRITFTLTHFEEDHIMPYSRTARQSKHDVGSCVIDTLPKIDFSYGYLRETAKHNRTSYTIGHLKRDARLYLRNGQSFQKFTDYVNRIYVGNPDFVWNPKKKVLFEAHMEQLKQSWPVKYI